MNVLSLCSVDDVADNAALLVETGGFAYAVFRSGGRWYVTADACTHGPGSLSEGSIEGREIECPFHGGRFDLASGEPTSPPCYEPIAAWEPTIVDGRVCIDADAPR
jgi:anthranilate 1,2-dioxygenase ferredoxin subunit